MTFGELAIGQRFRVTRGNREREWIKVEPVRLLAGWRISYNAQSVDGNQHWKFGHSRAVVVPPYDESENL